MGAQAVVVPALSASSHRADEMTSRTKLSPEGYDFPLDFHWKTNPSFIARAGVPLTGHPRAVEARNSIMTSLVRAALAGQGGWVSYSRAKRFYEPLSRYEGTAFTYDRVKAAVQELLDLDLVEEERALPGPASHGWQSRMRATDRLIAAFRDCPFQHVGPRELIELRDIGGERMAYVDTDHTRRLRKSMQARNEALAGIRVEMPEGEGWIHTFGHVSARSEKGKKGWVGLRPTPVPQMVRIYGRGRWDLHGRLYGWWQQLPQARRIELLINGEVAFESDWSACHPTLLYAMAGKVPVGKIYDVHGYEPGHVKAALLTVMNTKTTYGAVLSLMKREKDDPGEWPHSLDYTKSLMKAVTHRHEPIAHLLGADMGITLMHIESQMCVDVLKRCERENVPALPVHDSFVTQASKGATVTAIMAEIMEAKCAGINSCQATRKSRFTPQMGTARPLGIGSVPPAPSHGDAMVKTTHTPAIPSQRLGKVVSRPVQPILAPVALPAPQASREALTPDWDLAERTLALTAHYEQAMRSMSAHAQHVLGCPAATPGEMREAYATAHRNAVAMAQQEWSEGRRLVDRVPDRLSDKAKAQRVKTLASMARRPKPRARKPSPWAKRQETSFQGRAKPQGSLFPGARP